MTINDLKSLARKNLGIRELNDLQLSSIQGWKESRNDIIILSPTGSGKSLAYLIPIIYSISKLNSSCVNAVIIAPTRELVIQISEVAKKISSGIRIVSCYGGHNVTDEKKSLEVTPQLIVSTPGRLVDHLNRNHISISNAQYLVLDEFDKSLQLGFLDEIGKILRAMPHLQRTIFVSATAIAEYPDFITPKKPLIIDFSSNESELKSRTEVFIVDSETKDKLNTLEKLLYNIPEDERCIIFVNYRESVERIVRFLRKNGIDAGYYHGGIDQLEREKAIALFNNGTIRILVCTDLGSRGLDIEEVNHIIHYHLPADQSTFTHRNGRTARIDKSGKIYVITSPDEDISFIDSDYTSFSLSNSKKFLPLPKYISLFFSEGKKEKLSKGDIVGFLVNKGNASFEDIGIINVFDHYSIAAIKREKAKQILKNVSHEKIKNHRVKISIATQPEIND